MKGDDDVMTGLREEARAQRQDDARWEAVARGEATAEELAELERRAEHDPEIAAMLAACRPLGADAEARIAARATGALSAKAAEADAAGPAAGAATAAVVPLRAAREGRAARSATRLDGRRLVAWAGPIAVAAAVVLYVAFGARDDGRDLPPYAITASGEQATRGAGDAPSARLRLGKSGDARFELALRPETSAAVKVVAYVFAVGDGEPSPVDAKVEVAETGSVRVTGRARALEGAREIRVVVGAPESIGKFADALARARTGRGDDRVRVLTVAVDRD